MTEARTVTVRIPGDVCKALAPNRTKGFHWAVHHQSRHTYKGLALLMWRQMGQERFVGKVRLTFTVFRGRTLDPDGALGAMKPIIDGLKGEAFTDDSARFVELAPVRFVTGKAWAGVMACTEVKIESVNDEE